MTRCAPLCVLPLSSIIIAVQTETHPGSTSRLPEVAQTATDVRAHPLKGALSSGTRWMDRADDRDSSWIVRASDREGIVSSDEKKY